MLDLILVIAGAVCLIIGIAGSILPALPGPPFAWVGLLLLKWHSTAGSEIGTNIIIWSGIAVLLVTALDYWLPVWGTAKFGGSSWGKWGSMIGMIAGFIIPIVGPFTFIIGPFIGAVAGELLKGEDMKKALRSGWGSFIGFLGGAIAKVLVCLWLCYLFIVTLV